MDLQVVDPWEEQLQQRMALARKQGWSNSEIAQSAQLAQLQHQQELSQQQSMKQSLQNRQQGNKENWLQKILPSVGGIGGGAGGAALGASIGSIIPGLGTAVGGIVGALAGGALGGGTGKVIENTTSGQDWDKGVGKEALLNGVLAAGPLRLGKFAVDTAKGVKAGRDLLEATNAGATSAKNLSLLKSVGNKVGDKGTGLIAKEFRLTPTQQFNFKKLHGEDATDVLRRYGIKKPEQIADRIQPLQDSFNGVVDKIPSINSQDLAQGLKSVYQPLLNSPAIFEKQLGGQLKAQADELVKQAGGGNLSASDINKMRQLFDSAVNYTQRGAPEYNVLKKTADALRKTLQTSADNAGVTVGGKSFRDIGLELNKLHGLNDIVGRQAYNGTGSLPLSLPNLLGGVSGAATGGLPGTLAGITATAALNSPTGRRLLANGAIKTGEKLAARGARNLTSPFGIKAASKRIAPIGLLEAMNQSSANSIPTTAPINSTTTTPTTANMPEQYTNSPGIASSNNSLSGGAGLSSEEMMSGQPESYAGSVQYYLDGAQRAAAAGDFKSAGDLMDMAKTVSALTETPTQEDSHTKATAQQYAIAQSGLGALSQLAQMIQSDPGLVEKSAIPGQGLPVVGGLVSRATGTGQYNALANQVLDAIARARTGAAMTHNEESFYHRLLPQAGDNQATINEKLQQLYAAFQPFVSGGSDSAGDLLAQMNAASTY